MGPGVANYGIAALCDCKISNFFSFYKILL